MRARGWRGNTDLRVTWSARSTGQRAVTQEGPGGRSARSPRDPQAWVRTRIPRANIFDRHQSAINGTHATSRPQPKQRRAGAMPRAPFPCEPLPPVPARYGAEPISLDYKQGEPPPRIGETHDFGAEIVSTRIPPPPSPLDKYHDSLNSTSLPACPAMVRACTGHPRIVYAPATISGQQSPQSFVDHSETKRPAKERGACAADAACHITRPKA